jgi:hypothetical protein
MGMDAKAILRVSSKIQSYLISLHETTIYSSV